MSAKGEAEVGFFRAEECIILSTWPGVKIQTVNPSYA